ncbi:hypothetical protein ACX0G9_11635 [Flavitalea flava]
MDSIAKYIKKEKDIFYLIGEKKGEEKKAIKLVENLLLNTDFAILKVANLAEVSEGFVRKVKKTLK